jgi:RNA polymerase sigma-70 factor, ECF subfamily
MNQSCFASRNATVNGVDLFAIMDSYARLGRPVGSSISMNTLTVGSMLGESAGRRWVTGVSHRSGADRPDGTAGANSGTATPGPALTSDMPSSVVPSAARPTAVSTAAALAVAESRPREPGLPAGARMEALHAAHADPLFRYLLRLALGELQLAEDLLQETMARAWRNIEALAVDLETQRRWLFTVARRIAIDAARARQARVTEVGALDLTRMPSEGDAAEAVVAVEMIRAALAKVSRDHRTVLVALYLGGLSIGEVASSLGIAEGTVKSRAHYGLRALRAAIGSVDAR